MDKDQQELLERAHVAHARAADLLDRVSAELERAERLQIRATSERLRTEATQLREMRGHYDNLLEELRTMVTQLQEALVSRATIEQAKGILMVMRRCDADAAFDALRRLSQHQNRKLREVAAEIVERTGAGASDGAGAAAP